MVFVFPPEAIDLLRDCRYDPKAQPGYEMISGGLFWSDENIFEFVGICRGKDCSDSGALLAFRTSLIEDKPREELRYAWEEIRVRCPEWIGFRAERMTPDVELQEYLRREAEDF